MNWEALNSTILLFITAYSTFLVLRLLTLNDKSKTVFKIWEHGAYMLVAKTISHELVPEDQEILALCEMCRVAANEIADDARNYNPSYWILTARKTYNIPAIVEHYATLRNYSHPILLRKDRESGKK